MNKKILTTALVTVLVPALAFGATACSGADSASAETVVASSSGSAATAATAASGSGSTASSSESATATVTVASEALTASWDTEDTDAAYDASSAYQITLNGDSIAFTGTGATVSGSTITITEPGTYVLSGTLNHGQIVVDTATGGNVRLVLSGADITCSTSAPIYVKNADKAIITLADGTDNKVTDGSNYQLEDSTVNEPNAAIFSKDDLSINGSGSLTVKANYKNGIGTTNDLKIAGGTITVDAVNDAIQGKDSLSVKAGTITVNAGGNGLQATNDNEAEKGYIVIEGGTFAITTGGDAVEAVTTLAVAGGELTLTTAGGSSSGKTDSSAKGLKAAGGIFVSGGTVTVDSADDSINSDGTVKVTGGTITIKSGDDGIHAETAFQMDDGVITITQSYEGIESMVETFNGGTAHITASDDGINVAGGADGSASGNFRGGGGDMANNANNILTINGGYIAIDSGGDGLDSNGSVYMNGGTAIVNGPTNNGNGAIDYNGEFKVTAGYLVAAGSSGMAEVPGESSSICSILVNFSSAQQAGTLVHIESADGEEIVTMAPSKQFQSIVVTSAAIEQGATYKVYLGGSSTGTVQDTTYAGGDYSGGTEYASLAIEGIVTTSGSGGGMGGPQGGGRKKPGQ